MSIPFLDGTPIGTLDLGLDPTPDQVRRGRDVFLDGGHSKDGRFSCASCHPRGMSDQLGWGWDLFGTAGAAWTPYLTGLVPGLQSAVLLVGLVWASRTAVNIAGEDSAVKAPWREASPVVLYCLLITIGFLWLLVG